MNQMKLLKSFSIILTGLIFVACAYLISTYWSNYKIIPVTIVAYASFISLILLKDKTKIFNKLFEWVWERILTTSNRLIVFNIILSIIFLLICWTGYNQFKKNNYNAYLTVYEKNSANYIKDEQAEMFNIMTKEKLVIRTDETGRGIFHVDIPSVWQKTYKNYRFPEERVESAPYSFKIDLATFKTDAVKIETKNISETEIQNIDIYQMPEAYVNRSASIFINYRNFENNKYLIAGISNLTSFIERQGYIVSYNKLLKVPNCIAYRTFQTKNIFERSNHFRPDKELESALNLSYNNSGYDKGHLISVPDMFCHSEKAADEAFLTSVIAPQAPKMNRGIWLKLEQYTRLFISDTVYIIAGTLFLNNDGKGNTLFPVIGNEKIAVPSHFYRIISRKVNGTIQALAFIIPNANIVEQDFSKYLVSVQDIEKKTGIIFFSNLPQSEQKFKNIIPEAIWKQ